MRNTSYRIELSIGVVVMSWEDLREVGIRTSKVKEAQFCKLGEKVGDALREQLYGQSLKTIAKNMGLPFVRKRIRTPFIWPKKYTRYGKV